MSEYHQYFTGDIGWYSEHAQEPSASMPSVYSDRRERSPMVLDNL